MSGEVTCKVCGCASPVGTAECPDCGAPLPQEVEGAQAEAEELPLPMEEGEDAVPAARPPSKKRRWLAGAAMITAACLLAALTAPLLFPGKEPVPGAAWVGEGLATPDGVWDFEAEGLSVWHWTAGDVYWDGEYWLLSEGGGGGSDPGSRVVLYGDYVWSSSKYGDADQTTDGQKSFYLFDGQVIEPLEGDAASLTDNGVLFYTQTEPDGLGFYRRELKTGKTARVDVFPEDGDFALLMPSPEGDAVAYRWSPEDGEEGELRLWTAKSGKVQTPDCPGQLWSVGRGGACLFFGDGEDGRTSTSIAQAPTFVSELDGPRCHLWRDGELTELPGGMIGGWSSADLTEFVYQPDLTAATGKWYYYRVGQTDAPVALDVPEGSYLFSMEHMRNTHYASPDSLTGHFYTRYGTDETAICYLGKDLTLTDVVDGVDGLLAFNPSQSELIYQKDGGLLLIAVDEDGQVTTQNLTETGPDGVYRGGGTVADFGASEDLEHFYYVAQSDPDDYRAGKALYHRHGGKTTRLDFALDILDGASPVNLTVTPEGGCYIVYRRDAYYTEKDAPPTLLLEEVGSTAAVQLIGPQKWPLLRGEKWENNENKDHCWYLNGAEEPVELQDWRPEEGTV